MKTWVLTLVAVSLIVALFALFVARAPASIVVVAERGNGRQGGGRETRTSRDTLPLEESEGKIRVPNINSQNRIKW